ncbi:hypothetical protein M430DRAFT_18985 [Amorphotheca resinae ATCC 22711]|uniref:Uncharacterized protein n=1 Tax=Amorphotheca resinae ATCC 22711 TaxID=857342 RepID=A0A2T3B1F2_AMORE|nr:hypothetical protein M430DRAFT_18985 [Amorphotheca resinae ATCC 22711]PSS18385.1 hypothetical protein M430DRAFT_18985 [Amorphotheca resinae ATCC 22711]
MPDATPLPQLSSHILPTYLCHHRDHALYAHRALQTSTSDLDPGRWVGGAGLTPVRCRAQCTHDGKSACVAKQKKVVEPCRRIRGSTHILQEHPHKVSDTACAHDAFAWPLAAIGEKGGKKNNGTDRTEHQDPAGLYFRPPYQCQSKSLGDGRGTWDEDLTIDY